MCAFGRGNSFLRSARAFLHLTMNHLSHPGYQFRRLHLNIDAANTQWLPLDWKEFINVRST